MLWTVLSLLFIIMHKRERGGGKRGETVMNFHVPPDSTSNYFDYRHKPQQPAFYLGFGTKRRALWGTLQPELHLQARNLLIIARRGSFEAVLRLARECTCFWILKIHGKLLVAEKWGFGNIMLYLKLIVMNSCTIFKGLCKWFPYTSQTSCELGKVTAQTMWKSKVNLASVDFVSI